MDFEKSLERLREISAEMEKPDLALDKAVALYSEAARLVESCKTDIENAKLEIKKLESGGQG
ncbi:MAG: exodeoxyribonuclease VII small subunit [Ruminiclostridium sp.]|nr:exodeoxyribonuclease VII small subunit [Ruminiclostridium sp.]